MTKVKANIISINPAEKIISKIYVIRGQKIMLDRDLADLYEIETRVLNQAVKRNIQRFPKDFMFQLSLEEFENWKSQIVMSNSTKMGLRKLPYAFTEQGVAMLSGVINSPKAISMNIAIMRAFVEIRKVLMNNKKIAEQFQKLDERIGEHDVQLNSIYEAIENLLDDKSDKQFKDAAWKARKRIGF